MNIITHIEFGNNQVGIYNHDTLVTEVHTHFSRQFNAFHPSSIANCTSLDISIIAPLKDDLFFQEWYVNNGVHSGRLKFELMNLDSRGESASERYLWFFDAQCYYLGERYDINDKSLRIMDLKLKPVRCMIDKVDFGEVEKTDEMDEMDKRILFKLKNKFNNPFNGHNFQ